MLKSKGLLITIAILAALALTGCNTSTTSPKGGAAAAQSLSVADGARQMLSQLDELKEALATGDAAKAKQLGEALDDTWARFEDRVKADSKALYVDIEEPLHAIKAGTREGKALDQAILNEQAAKLAALLDPLTK